jgi:hypothetical protein
VGAPWNQGTAEAEAAIAEVSLFLRDLPAGTSDPVKAGRCRRALARCRSRDGGPSDKWAVLRGVSADLRTLGYQGVLPS